MTVQEKEQAKAEVERLCELLEENEVPYTLNGYHVTFNNRYGECTAYPSQTYDGLLRVTYTTICRCAKAEQALSACGVLEDE